VPSSRSGNKADARLLNDRFFTEADLRQFSIASEVDDGFDTEACKKHILSGLCGLSGSILFLIRINMSEAEYR
jgi:hypothetical protein